VSANNRALDFAKDETKTAANTSLSLRATAAVCHNRGGPLGNDGALA
jgi:hypothetical protein